MLHVLRSVLQWVDADQTAQASQTSQTIQTTETDQTAQASQTSQTIQTTETAQTTQTTHTTHLRLLDLTGNYATEQDSPRLHALCQELQKRGVVVEGLVLWNGVSIRAA